MVEFVVLSTGSPLARTAYFVVLRIGHGSFTENAAPALLNSCSDAPTRVKSVELQAGVGDGVEDGVEEVVEDGVEEVVEDGVEVVEEGAGVWHEEPTEMVLNKRGRLQHRTTYYVYRHVGR